MSEYKPIIVRYLRRFVPEKVNPELRVSIHFMTQDEDGDAVDFFRFCSSFRDNMDKKEAFKALMEYVIEEIMRANESAIHEDLTGETGEKKV